MLTTAFRAVLFDVGGVLTQPLGPLVLEAALATGLDLTGMREALGPMFSSVGDNDEPAHMMERGELTLDSFLDGLGSASVAARALFDPASEHYVFTRFTPHAGMVALARDARAAGLVIGVVSNVINEWLPAWSAVLAASGLLFDDRVMSCEVGLRKPNPAIYELALARLGLAAESTLFIDDFAPMAQGARDVGIAAITLTDHDEAIIEARRLLGLSNAL
jgi:putative hydrolase of the HAD superfamily